MRALTYEALIAELFPRLTGGIRWGLERTQRMLASVGEPHRRFKVVHIGGTNGKGSVAAHIEAVLRRAGHRTGLYTSPHLCSFRERVRIDGSAIAAADLVRAAEQLWDSIQVEQPSFFEATTAIAFQAMAEAEIDVGVVEVGLGGRLDATNVVMPEVVVLTNVSLDHVQLLGPTAEHVAREKAGIIKHQVPVVTAESGTAAARLFAAAAGDLGAPLHVVTSAEISRVESGLDGTSLTLDGTGWGRLQLKTPLPGRHQALNSALAARALDVAIALRPSRQEVCEGMARVRWPGRLQVSRVADVTWVFDVAHNVAGVDALTAAIGELHLPRPLVALVAVLGDKDWANMLVPLQGMADHIVLTQPPTAPADRRWQPEEALRVAPSSVTRIVEDFTTALEYAHALCAEAQGSILVTGSFHTVGDALVALGLCEYDADHPVRRPVFAAAI